MKKASRTVLTVGIVVAALLGVLAIATFPGMGAVRRTTVDPVNLSTIADGTYPGTFKAGRFSYSVEVTVKDHRIEAVKSTGGKQSQDSIVRQVFARTVESQSVKVDTVSGASLTTKAVSKAAENALRQAH